MPFEFTAYMQGITRFYDPVLPPNTLREYVTKQRDLRVSTQRGPAIQAFATRYSSVAKPDALKAIGQGFQTATQVADMAKALGPKGVAIGAAVGLIGGFVAGIIPTEQNAAEAQWDSIVEAMSPIDRYCVFAAVKPIAVRNCRKQGIILPGGNPLDPVGPWRWADDPAGGHSPWGGPVGKTVNFLERLFRQPCVPDSVLNDTQIQRDQLALYVLLFCGGAHDDGKMPWEMRAVWPLLAEGRTAPALVKEFGPYSNVRFGELRAMARRRGITNIWNPILTPSMRQVLRGS
jgi:hypothetical protein